MDDPDDDNTGGWRVCDLCGGPFVKSDVYASDVCAGCADATPGDE